MPITHENQYHLPSRNLFILGALAAAVLTALVGYSYYWNTDNIKKENLNLALSTAKAIWNKDAAFRQWATGHGGVYVEPDERTPRSASLAHLPERDVVTTDGRELTLMNPAYMMRQMTEEFEETYGIKGKITGKILLNPINAPDEWQLMALNFFESGEADEIYEQQNIDGQPYLRYMRAMYMTEGCEKCHGILGFKVGDLRGGVSVSTPLTPLFNAAVDTNRGVFITHLVVWVVGLVAIALFIFFTRRSLVQLDNTVCALRISHEQLRALTNRMNEAREEERTIIARNMHDELGQALTGVKMDLEWLLNHLPKNQKKLDERANSMVVTAESMIDFVRKLAFQLRPAVLDDLGLEAAIDLQVAESAGRVGYEYKLDFPSHFLELDSDRSTSIFRIFQEILTNVARHAQASMVEVIVTKNDSELLLKVKDNGIGITDIETAGNRSLGIVGMRERAAAFGGTVTFESAEGGGTVVTLSIPMAGDTA